ncbi:hypothetical protein GH714_025084 [Hevea brasiliensis]|uniref:Peptidase S59 domain-containing protein n=1 Tax=Hevea brasiliensis TaxID=3981 RepID=A0A6A6LPD0_HEVBR|nr:hypothetical protein GH714_024910 [Hevea brasiliensis]KAF2301489.1 hypothetical protein GH714_025084 [Hevea brasiliensis]
MESPSLLPLPGDSNELRNTICNAHVGISCGLDCEIGSSSLQTQYKKRISPNNDKSYELLKKVESSLPILHSTDYYMEPALTDLAAQELVDPGYCSRVPDFTVGRLGYGRVKFLGMTDIRGLDLDQIVKFHRHEIVVYKMKLLSLQLDKALTSLLK